MTLTWRDPEVLITPLIYASLGVCCPLDCRIYMKHVKYSLLLNPVSNEISLPIAQSIQRTLSEKEQESGLYDAEHELL